MELSQGSGGRLPGEAVLTVCPLPDRPGLEAAGEISLSTRPIWEGALERLARCEDDVFHMEMSGVTFIDVAGASALARTAHGLGEGRRVVVSRPPGTLRRLLELFWPDLAAMEVTL
ncbi:STAS domain-containing protein [Streptomyces sp. NPDC052496]|uniref:STAS domain-containing protein n=1 Tax=Streptomyces sp. NPDC052496 TaxID=3154951 RepID=UPI003417E4C7